MNIIEFINSHPLINWGGVEKIIGAPKGTIRVNSNRSIPAKYMPLIMSIITDYGYNNDASQQQETITIKPINTGGADMYEFTYYRDMIRYISTEGNKSIKPEGLHIYIKKDDIKLPFEYIKSY